MRKYSEYEVARNNCDLIGNSDGAFDAAAFVHQYSSIVAIESLYSVSNRKNRGSIQELRRESDFHLRTSTECYDEHTRHTLPQEHFDRIAYIQKQFEERSLGKSGRVEKVEWHGRQVWKVPERYACVTTGTRPTIYCRAYTTPVTHNQLIKQNFCFPSLGLRISLSHAQRRGKTP
jgi:hypothetical protein